MSRTTVLAPVRTTSETGTTADAGTHSNGGIELANLSQETIDSHQAPQQPKLSKKTLLKLLSAGFSFFVAGVNDGSLGALIPYVIRDYGITTAVLSSV